ncbi:MAG: 16S rRNA (guanine(527)-N(7))-methyltransferase RsmG [Deltaproteobacteria bacterium]|nr:16S rRNA (guanine(527)-N(7))-methyltransferase RsmG [Deltaproteobacteria bacterium]
MPKKSPKNIDRVLEEIRMEIPLDDISVNLISQFIDILRKWNRVHRLVGNDDVETLYDKQIFDIVPLSSIVTTDATIVDLGAGAGLPTIPLQIARHDIRTILIESRLKKVNFCQQACRSLGIERVLVLQGDAGSREVCQRCGPVDLAFSRATWDLAAFLAIARPYVTRGGLVVAMKGADCAVEISQAATVAKEIGLYGPEVKRYQLPISRKERTVLKYWMEY